MYPIISLLRQGLYLGALGCGGGMLGFSISHHLRFPYPLNIIIAAFMSGAIFFILD